MVIVLMAGLGVGFGVVVFGVVAWAGVGAGEGVGSDVFTVSGVSVGAGSGVEDGDCEQPAPSNVKAIAREAIFFIYHQSIIF